MVLHPAWAGEPAAESPTAGSGADLRRLIASQAERLAALRRTLADQEAELDRLRQRVDAQDRVIAAPSGTAPTATSAAVSAAATGAKTATGPSAQLETARSETATEVVRGSVETSQAADSAGITAVAKQVASIFQQPGVLTPRGHATIEPSFQYSYSSSNRVALEGVALPVILVGRIDVREVKSTTLTGALTLRYGLTDRAEIEAKLPYLARYDTSLSRAPLEGSSGTSSVFDADGHGIGDVEFTGRYQLNEGGADKPYYVGSLRLKTRTGRDPFQIPVSTAVTGFGGQGLQSELATGSGFYGIQPALSVLLPSDPAVFFGTVSMLYSPSRSHLVRRTDQGTESLGTIAPGLIFGFNVGMGIALNERSSFSIGYDHSAIGKTKQNGQTVAESVRLQLGTLLLGLSYRLDDRRTVNLALGAGMTRDTPDVTLSVRVPTSF